MRHGWAVNLAGGYHHASARLSRGHGFCVIADISLMVEHLRRTYRDRVRRILIIDLDAHQGDGHEHDCQNDSDVTIIDGYHHRIFPGACDDDDDGGDEGRDSQRMGRLRT